MRFLVALLVACASAKPAPVAVVDTPAAPTIDPACPTGKTFTLADGKLRCRELPFVVDFPAGSQLEREDSDNLTFIRATLDRGVLAVFLEPRFEILPGDDASGLKKRIEALVTGIASDATIVDASAPPQPGATIATALSFTTPDGGAGTVYAYLAHGWFVAVIAGGRLAATPARPDQPMGKAFLASFALRPIAQGWESRDVDGVKLELPLSAWEQLTTEAGAKLWAASTEQLWLGMRTLDPSPQCALFANVTDADVPALVKKMFGREDLAVTGKLVDVATKSLYAELETPGGMLAMYLVCDDPKVTLVTVVGKRPSAELRATLDRMTSSFRRSTKPAAPRAP